MNIEEKSYIGDGFVHQLRINLEVTMFKINLPNNSYKNDYNLKNHEYFEKVNSLFQSLDKHVELDIKMNILIDYSYNSIFFPTNKDKNVPFNQKTIYKEIKIFFFMQILYHLSYLKEKNRYLHIQDLPYWINRFKYNHRNDNYISLSKTETKEYKSLSNRNEFNDRYNNPRTLKNNLVKLKNSEYLFSKNKHNTESEPHIVNDKYYLNLFLLHFKRFELKEYTNIKNMNNQLNDIDIEVVQNDNRRISNFFQLLRYNILCNGIYR